MGTLSLEDGSRTAREWFENGSFWALLRVGKDRKKSRKNAINCAKNNYFLKMFAYMREMYYLCPDFVILS